ncbi:MAG: M23 family metallopeptidase, partial [Chloroflexi bacterium]|nr:M23 family metallopeptidase [Chloroflexota bacterium]
GETLYTVYGHLGRVDVLVGQHVEAGDPLGIVGQTGKVTGPHLHFEVRIGRNNFFVSRNPELWLAPPQGWGILAARLTDSFGELLSGQVVTVISKTNAQVWTVKTYGKGAAISDTYYQENLTLGDLPEGDYVVWIPYEGGTYNLDIHISPGRVSYFKFHGLDGVTAGLPATPRPAFTPPPPVETPAAPAPGS